MEREWGGNGGERMGMVVKREWRRWWRENGDDGRERMERGWWRENGDGGGERMERG